MPKIFEMKDQRARAYREANDARAEARKLAETAEQEERDLTEDEAQKHREHMDAARQKVEEAEQLEQKIADAEYAAAIDEKIETGLSESKPERQTPPEDPDRTPDVKQRDPVLDDRKRGFESYGEFARAVYDAGRNGFVSDARLQKISGAAATTFGNEGTGADGGFLVPPEFSQRIYQHALMEDAFLPMTDENPIGGNSMSFPADETTPWGSDGIRAYWEDEGAQGTQTKPSVKLRSLRMKKLIGLVPVTDELLSDANALENYIEGRTARSIRWKTNDALVNGSGGGRPLGITQSNALVSVTRDTSNEINYIDVANMFARMPGESITRAVWLVNNDAYPQVMTMTNGNQPVFTPSNGGAQDAPAGRLLGRPIILTQTAASVGSANDIMLVDWMSYVTITKSGGIQTATSIHLFFDAHQTAFRATFRVDGQPWLDNAISPNNGSNSLSPFVALGTA